MGLSSYLDISFETANRLYSWGWKASLIGAAITLIGVSLLMWGTRVRDRNFEARVSETMLSAGTADERTAELGRQAAELRRVLERERAERLKIEVLVAPRRLTKQEHDVLVHALRKVPKPVVVQVTRLGEQEAAAYADELLVALTDGSVALEVDMLGSTSPPTYGIVLTLNTNDPKALAVKMAFEGANIPIHYSVADMKGVNARILVGLKPAQ